MITFGIAKYTLFEHKIVSHSTVAPEVDGVTVKIISEKEFQTVPDTFKEIIPDWQEKLRKGFLCVGAFENGKCAHISWVSMSGFYICEIDRTIMVGADAGYLFGTHTLPELQRRYFYSHVFDKIIKELFNIGKTKLYVLVSDKNLIMLNFQKKHDAIQIGSLTHVKFLNVRLNFMSDCKKNNSKISSLLNKR